MLVDRKVAIVAVLLAIVALGAATFEAEPDFSIAASTTDCFKPDEIEGRWEAPSTQPGRNLRKGKDDEDEDEDEDKDESTRKGLKLDFGSQHQGRHFKLMGAILNFDTFDVPADVCKARLHVTLNHVRGDFALWCAGSPCIAVDVAPTRFGFEDDSFEAPGVALASTVTVREDDTIIIDLDTANLDLRSQGEYTQLRITPAFGAAGQRKVTARITQVRFEILGPGFGCVVEDVLPEVEENSGLVEVWDQVPPAWASNEEPTCAIQPEFCSWSGTADVTGGCGDAACSLSPIASTSQFDGGFSYAAFSSDDKLGVIAIRPQYRFCGLAYQTPLPNGRTEVPVAATAGTYAWNYDFSVLFPDGDLYDPSLEVVFTYTRQDGTPQSVEASLDDYLAFKAPTLPPPLALVQESTNLGFFGNPQGVALGFDSTTVDVQLDITLAVRSRADPSNVLASSTVFLQTVSRSFECGGSCGDVDVGCRPLESP